MKSDSNIDKYILTPFEVLSNRFFAILLALAVVPYFLNILTAPTIIIYFSFASFLWFGKKYRIFPTIIFLLLALIIYFFDIEPVGWGLYRMLRGIKVGLIELTRFGYTYYLAPIIFTTFAFRNILGRIFAAFKPSITWRNYFYAASLIVTLAILLGYPLLRGIGLRDKTANVAPSGRLSEVYTRQSLTFLDRYIMAGYFTSKYDLSTKKYVYHLQLKEPLKEAIQFSKVEMDNEKINILSDDRLECQNCQNIATDPSGLIFPLGKSIDLTIRSDELIKIIKFTETDYKTTEFVFWK
jgi:hypothetical protein